VGYQTPETLPTTKSCRAINIPDDEGFLAVVTSALQTLTFPDHWDKFGADTPEEAAELCAEMFDDFVFGKGGCRVVGEILAFAGSDSPNADWLPCDGSSLLRVDYPDLFTVIGTTFGSSDGSHFNIPDLRGRAGIGSGTGQGLTARSLGAQLGEEDHTLTIAETPNHSHTDSGHSHTEGVAVGALINGGLEAPAAAALPSLGVTGTGYANLGGSGSDNPHNNIQPSLVLNYLIVAR